MRFDRWIWPKPSAIVRSTALIGLEQGGVRLRLKLSRPRACDLRQISGERRATTRGKTGITEAVTTVALCALRVTGAQASARVGRGAGRQTPSGDRKSTEARRNDDA